MIYLFIYLFIYLALYLAFNSDAQNYIDFEYHLGKTAREIYPKGIYFMTNSYKFA